MSSELVVEFSSAGLQTNQIETYYHYQYSARLRHLDSTIKILSSTHIRFAGWRIGLNSFVGQQNRTFENLVDTMTDWSSKSKRQYICSPESYEYLLNVRDEVDRGACISGTQIKLADRLTWWVVSHIEWQCLIFQEHESLCPTSRVTIHSATVTIITAFNRKTWVCEDQ